MSSAPYNSGKPLDLLIVGAGGAGREIYCWARESDHPEWEIAGFLDRNRRALEDKHVEAGIVGDPDDWQPKPGELFICSMGDTRVRKQLCELLESRGASFAVIRHPSAVIAPGSLTGHGCIFSPHTLLGPDAILGEHVYLNAGANVHHDARVGNWCFVGPHVSVLGGVRLGDGVFIGANACLLPGISVGDFATVGAGAVVTRDVKAAATVYGVPAQEV